MAPFSKKSGIFAEDYFPLLCSPEELEASYARCRACGVPQDLTRPREILDPAALTPRLKAAELLLSLAEKTVKPICTTDSQRNFICILCDPELVALKLYASPEILEAAAKVGVVPGTVFTEESCGTNALALAREHKRLIAIRGEQHFCQFFHNWCCVAAPVQGLGNSTLGYLDISMHAERELGFAVTFLKTLLLLMKKELALAREISSLPLEIERRLSPREREILFLLLRRLTNEEIAAYLNLSVYTVKTYRKFIYRKLGVSSFNELLAKYRTAAERLDLN
ncbi:transcriptional regulator, LuxR family [Ammonifex degensii KC4]|uniref:Transcriptional regulator, LuxR family n=1 Tax=Ammonifex degensii (strain DSM 10501 / KC4) TaxID=429009 RepID=C9R9Z7_AMMDK|nr:helix-turn-helix transcriptional regulator [Ammonifex degensii]ACX53126.1 transcriptional regulator, LuxR family [Ammonifex degensii KC4]